VLGSSPVARAASLFPSNFSHDASLFSPAKRIEVRSGRGDAARDDHHGGVLTSLLFQQQRRRGREEPVPRRKDFFRMLVATSEPFVRSLQLG
jgi:hypothetical protein